MDDPLNPNPLGSIPAIVCGRDGGQCLNPAKFGQDFYSLVSEDDPIPTLANESKMTTLTPPADQGGAGDVEVHHLHADSTGEFAVSLTSTALNRRFMNQPVESTLVFGYPELPAPLPTPILIPATTSLEVETSDLSGANNDVSLAAMCSQFNDAAVPGIGARSRIRDAYLSRNAHPYWLTTDSGAQVTAEANTTTTFEFTVPSSADFLVLSLLARVSGAASNLKVRIFKGSRQSLSNKAVRIDQLFSVTRSVTGMPGGGLIPAASLPSTLPRSVMFRRKTILSVEVTNSDAAQDISLCFAGVLLYYPECR